MAIKHKQKICKGTGRAKERKGCGDKFFKRTYGLCQKCYKDWLLNTESGSKQIERVSIKVKKDAKVQKQKEIRKQKDSIMSNDQYRKKYIQPRINELIRIIDFGQNCIATNRDYGQMQAGHYFSTGSNRTLTYHPHNIFLQSAESNNHKGGDDKNYRLGLIETFGIEYTEWIESSRHIEPIKLSRPELELSLIHI